MITGFDFWKLLAAGLRSFCFAISQAGGRIERYRQPFLPSVSAP
ncbi:MAG: hypothetical protein ACR2QB_10340 [Gammaproteobacteria bacterium]